jgi:hypothetical protein
MEPGDIVMDSFGLSDTKSHSPVSPRPIAIEAPDVNTKGLQGLWRAHRRGCIFGDGHPTPMIGGQGLFFGDT